MSPLGLLSGPPSRGSLTLTPVIVRATALSLLRNYPGRLATEQLLAGLDDAESLIRYSAIRGLQNAEQAVLQVHIAPKLYDPVKAVRIEAAAALARLPERMIREDDRAALADSIRQLDDLFLLVVAGEFNAGKSAFINALLGQNIQIEGVTPTTSQIYTVWNPAFRP